MTRCHHSPTLTDAEWEAMTPIGFSRIEFEEADEWLAYANCLVCHSTLAREVRAQKEAA